jgi:hypothetical protein
MGPGSAAPPVEAGAGSALESAEPVGPEELAEVPGSLAVLLVELAPEALAKLLVPGMALARPTVEPTVAPAVGFAEELVEAAVESAHSRAAVPAAPKDRHYLGESEGLHNVSRRRQFR